MANKTYRIDGSAIKLDDKSLVANEQGQIELVRATEEEAKAGTDEYKVIVPATAKVIAGAAVEGKQDKLTSANAGDGIKIERDPETDVVTISNTNLSAEWGNIEGTLSDQTDLQDALDAKQDKLVESDSIKIDSNNKITAVEATVGSTELGFNLKYNADATLNNETKIATLTADNDSYIQAPLTLQDFINADSFLIHLKLKDSRRIQFPEYFCFDVSPHIGSKDYNGLSVCYENGTYRLWAGNTGSGWNICSQIPTLFNPDINVNCEVELKFNGSSYELRGKAEGDADWTRINYVETSDKLGSDINPSNSYLTFGNNMYRGNNYQFNGDFYLEDCYVVLDGEEVWRGYSDVPSVGTKGIVNLYNTTGNAEDGSLTQKAASELHNAALLAIEAEETRAKAAESLKADKATTLAGYGITDADTSTEVDEKISSAIAGVYRVKSSVATYEDLPLTDNKQGDVRNVLGGAEEGNNFVWTSEESSGTLEDWDKLSGAVDLHLYATKEYVNEGLALKQDVLTAGTAIDITDNVVSAKSAVIASSQGKQANVLNHGATIDPTTYEATLSEDNSYLTTSVSVAQFKESDTWEVFIRSKFNHFSGTSLTNIISFDKEVHSNEDNGIDFQAFRLYDRQLSMLYCAATKSPSFAWSDNNYHSPLSLQADEIYDFKITREDDGYIRFYGKEADSDMWTTMLTTNNAYNIDSIVPDQMFLTLGNGMYRKEADSDISTQYYGSFLLDDCYVKLNNITVWKGTVEGTPAQKGIVNLYTEEGTNEDGALTQKAASELHTAIATTINSLDNRVKVTEAWQAGALDTLVVDNPNDPITIVNNFEGTSFFVGEEFVDEQGNITLENKLISQIDYSTMAHATTNDVTITLKNCIIDYDQYVKPSSEQVHNGGVYIIDGHTTQEYGVNVIVQNCVFKNLRNKAHGIAIQGCIQKAGVIQVTNLKTLDVRGNTFEIYDGAVASAGRGCLKIWGTTFDQIGTLPGEADQGSRPLYDYIADVDRKNVLESLCYANNFYGLEPYVTKFALYDTKGNSLIYMMKGATETKDGLGGLVPPPAIADKDKFLKGNGTWSAIDPGVWKEDTGVGSIVSIANASQGGQAMGDYSVAEGFGSDAKGNYSHAEGQTTTTNGNAAHAEGAGTTAQGNCAHAEGYETIAQNQSEHAEGNYNKSHKANNIFGNAGNTIHSIGIGTGAGSLEEQDRRNALEVMQNGDAYVLGVGEYDGTNIDTAETLQEVVNDKANKEDVYTKQEVDEKVIMTIKDYIEE